MEPTPQSPLKRDAANLKSAASDAGQQVTDELNQVQQQLGEQAQRQASAVASLVSTEIETLAAALETGSRQARDDGARLVHEPLRQLAHFCRELADNTDEQAPKTVIDKIEDYGRREPLALFGAAAALGFLGTRALRAGAEQRSAEPETHQPEQHTLASESGPASSRAHASSLEAPARGGIANAGASPGERAPSSREGSEL